MQCLETKKKCIRIGVYFKFLLNNQALKQPIAIKIRNVRITIPPGVEDIIIVSTHSIMTQTDIIGTKPNLFFLILNPSHRNKIAIDKNHKGMNILSKSSILASLKRLMPL